MRGDAPRTAEGAPPASYAGSRSKTVVSVLLRTGVLYRAGRLLCSDPVVGTSRDTQLESVISNSKNIDVYLSGIIIFLVLIKQLLEL